jgi:hypothetical protein
VKLFLVPLGREDEPRELFSSDLDVLVCPQKVSEPLWVERIKLKPHNSRPQFAVYKAHISFKSILADNYIWFKGALIKLGRVSPGTPILAKVDPRRPQRCLQYRGAWHSILTTYSNFRPNETLRVNLVCGDYSPKATRDLINNQRVLTCPECLAEKWLPFVVATYEMPEKVRKIQDKEEAERRFRAGIPTRFDRIDNEEEESEPEIVFVEDLEGDDPQEPEGRDAKLFSRVRHARRVKEAKARA